MQHTPQRQLDCRSISSSQSSLASAQQSLGDIPRASAEDLANIPEPSSKSTSDSSGGQSADRLVEELVAIDTRGVAHGWTRPRPPRMTQEDIDREDQEYEREEAFRSESDLVQQVLTLKLFAKYRKQAIVDKLPELGVEFDSIQSYFRSWMVNFQYETYCQLTKMRSDDGQPGSGSNQANGNQLRSTFKATLSFAHIKKKKKQHKPPYSNDNLVEYELDDRSSEQYHNIAKFKGFDLLLLSTKKLTEIEFKRVKTHMSGRMPDGLVLAMVTQSLFPDTNFVKVKVYQDRQNQEICYSACKNTERLYVYMLDSILTNFREYEALQKVTRNLDFSRHIFKPSSIKHEKNKKDKCRQRALQFLKEYHDKFNNSQFEAIEKVTRLNNNQFLLVQGPPGTGKTHVIQGMISMASQACKSGKIIVCAPSNVAVDEIVGRLLKNGTKFGFKNAQDVSKRTLRITSLDYEPANKAILTVTFEGKFRDQFPKQTEKERQQMRALGDHIQKLKEERDLLYEKAKDKDQELQKDEKFDLGFLSKTQSKDKYFNLIIRKLSKADAKHLRNVLDDLKKYENQFDDILEKKKLGLLGLKGLGSQQAMEFKNDVLKETQIICTTLSQMGKKQIQDHFAKTKEQIEYLIIDEACQSVELSTLIPMQYRPKRIILIGDQNQLPATTFSPDIARTKYDRSLFERFLQSSCVDKIMLDTQYRMDQAISLFPRTKFYDGALFDDVSVSERDLDPKFQESSIGHIKKEFGPLQFRDVVYSREFMRESSKYNIQEAREVIEVLKQIKQILDSKMGGQCQKGSQNHNKLCDEMKDRIGIITPYRGQVNEIKFHVDRFIKKCKGTLNEKMIEINTVDAFQGNEKDIIIFSCVRSMPQSSNTKFNMRRMIGFLADSRRMNVALTRAKHCLIVIGNQHTLQHELENWGPYLEHCSDYNFIKAIGESTPAKSSEDKEEKQ